LKEAGRKASAKSKCYSKAAAKGVAVDPACLAKAEGKFNSGWPKAEARADCLAPTGDLATIEGKVDAFIADLVSSSYRRHIPARSARSVPSGRAERCLPFLPCPQSLRSPRLLECVQ